jgi:hypothetical protein
LKDYEGIVFATCQTLVDALEKRHGEVLDMTAWMSYFSYVLGLLLKCCLDLQTMNSFDTMGALV